MQEALKFVRPFVIPACSHLCSIYVIPLPLVLCSLAYV